MEGRAVGGGVKEKVRRTVREKGDERGRGQDWGGLNK